MGIYAFILQMLANILRRLKALGCGWRELVFGSTVSFEAIVIVYLSNPLTAIKKFKCT